ncbi:MAG TPA: hypothetical protein VF292_04115 [Rhodanobacteraceae bacterium]
MKIRGKTPLCSTGIATNPPHDPPMTETARKPTRERRALAMLWPYVRRYPGRRQ